MVQHNGFCCARVGVQEVSVVPGFIVQRFGDHSRQRNDVHNKPDLFRCHSVCKKKTKNNPAFSCSYYIK